MTKIILALGGVMALAGCTDDGWPFQDPAAPESTEVSAPEQPMLAAAPTVSAQVTTLAPPARPDPGVPLLIHDASGALVARGVTDGDGRAWLAVPAGGSVTAIQDRTTMTTILDVRPGDALAFGGPPAGPVGHDLVLTGAQVSAAEPGDRLALLGSCIRVLTVDAPGGFTIAGDRECDGGRTDLVAIASGPGVDDRYLAAAGVAMTPSGVTLAGGYQPAATASVTVRGAGPMRDAWVHTEALTHGWSWLSLPGSNVRGEGPVDVPYVAGVGDRVKLVVHEGSTWHAHIAATIAGASIDLAAPHPSLAAPEVIGRVVRWERRGELGGDGAIVELDSPGRSTWRLVAPPGTVAVTLPELPPDLARVIPDPSARPHLSWIESSAIDGWDAFRRGGYLDPEGARSGAAVVDVIDVRE